MNCRRNRISFDFFALLAVGWIVAKFTPRESPFPSTSQLSHLVLSYHSLVSSVLATPHLFLPLPFPRSTYCARLLNPPFLAFSLSLHQHPYFCIPLSSRFVRYCNESTCWLNGSRVVHELMIEEDPREAWQRRPLSLSTWACVICIDNIEHFIDVADVTNFASVSIIYANCLLLRGRLV
jgi:hypothetical protein